MKEVHKKIVLSCPSLPLEGKNYLKKKNKKGLSWFTEVVLIDWYNDSVQASKDQLATIEET